MEFSKPTQREESVTAFCCAIFLTLIMFPVGVAFTWYTNKLSQGARGTLTAIQVVVVISALYLYK
jgi:hypothetical protein